MGVAKNSGNKRFEKTGMTLTDKLLNNVTRQCYGVEDTKQNLLISFITLV